MKSRGGRRSMFRAWLDLKKKCALSDVHLQMAWELDLDPERVARHSRPPTGSPASVARFIVSCYRRKFGREEPDCVLTLEQLEAQWSRPFEERKATTAASSADFPGKPDPRFLTSAEPEPGPAEGGRLVRLARPVSLKELVQELYTTHGGAAVYYDRFQGDFQIMTEDMEMLQDLSDEELAALPEHERADAEFVQNADEDERYVILPDQWEINQVRLLDRFAASIEDEALRRTFKDAVRGRGAFRRFRQLVQKHRLEDAWNRFETEGYAEIARDWLKEHDLPWRDDLDEPGETREPGDGEDHHEER
jgi:uncharacterized protein UPF0158